MKNILFTLAILFSLSLSSQTIVGSNGVVIINTGGGSGTDDQQLSIVGNTLTLEDGGTVDLSGYLDNKNVASGTLAGSNLTLTLTDSSTVVIDLAGLGSGGGGQSITTKDEGSTLTTETAEYNFTGSGVTASNTGGAVTVYIPGGSGSNLDHKAVEVSSENVLSDPTSQGKNLYISTTINLTGNVTVAEGATLIGMGGVINLGSNTITFQNNDFKSNSFQTYINIGQNGIISDASTFSSELTNYSLNWFGLVNDGDADLNTGTDNRNVLKQAEKIGRYSGASLSIDVSGDYVYSVLDFPQTPAYPNNFCITGTSSLYLAKGVVLGILPSTTSTYSILDIWEANNIRVWGQGEIKGDWGTRDYEGLGDQSGHGILISVNSKNVTIEVGVSRVASDCIIGRYNPEFIYINQLVESVFTKNYTIDPFGAFEENTKFAYSTLFSLANPSFANNGGFVVGGSSFSGLFGMKTQHFWAAFYDTNGIFISKSDLLETYTKIPIPTGAAQVRIIIYQPDIWANLSGTIYAPNTSSNITIKSPFLTFGTRQGISNLPSYSTIDGVLFEFNGRQPDGTAGSPGYGYDSEDGYQNLRYITVKNSTFRNNKGGDIILKGSVNFNIHNNLFAYNTYPEWVRVNSLSIANGHKTLFHHNRVQDRIFTTGREDNVHDNIFEDVKIEFNLEKEWIHDNRGFNVVAFNMALDSEDAYTTIENNVWRYDRPLSDVEYIFRTVHGAIWINNDFIFDDLVANNTNRLANPSSVNTGGGIPTGYIDGMKIQGLKGSPLNSNAFYTYCWNINRLESSISLEPRRGSPHDWAIENSKIEGFIYINPTDYPSTNGGNSDLYYTTTLKNVDITIDDLGLLVGTSYAFATKAVDLNIVYQKGTIDMQVSSNKFLDLNHYGTTIFKDVTFKANTPQDVNLSSLISGDTAYFIDCEFEGINLTLRSGDKRLFTKPHPDLEVYTDNTAALAGGIPPGYMYRTSDGTIKTTYNE